MNRSNMGMQIMKAPGSRKAKRMSGGGFLEDTSNAITKNLSSSGDMRALGGALGVDDRFEREMRKRREEEAARRAVAATGASVATSAHSGMSKGGRVQKPLYERPRPSGASKTMTPAQKAEAARIAKKGGDKKVGLFARINAMRKKK